MSRRALLTLPLTLLAALALTAVGTGQETNDLSLAGSGVATSPYLISNASELRQIERAPNAYFRLERGITLSGEWTPLCRETPFSGTLDGNGMTIKGLEIGGDSSGAELGLFAQIGASGRARNFELIGRIATTASTRAVGGVAGRLLGGAISEVESHVEIAVVDSTPSDVAIGGVVGYSEGIVFYCQFVGELQDARAQASAVGAIVGRTGKINPTALPSLVTAHAGFAAPNGASDHSEDNTIDNIIKTLRYRPGVIEVDVQPNADGTLVITHNKPKASDPTLEAVLRLLLGERPENCNDAEFDPEIARQTKIQLDAKADGIFLQELALADALQFPYNRIVMAGDARYETVLANKELIRAAVERGVDFWMNPNHIESYDSLAARKESFLTRIRALELPRMTVNSYYGAITDEIAEWLAENGLEVSIWTLNDKSSLRANFLRGFKNVTSRLPLAIEMRDQCASLGVYGSQFDPQYQEVGESQP